MEEAKARSWRLGQRDVCGDDPCVQIAGDRPSGDDAYIPRGVVLDRDRRGLPCDDRASERRRPALELCCVRARPGVRQTISTDAVSGRTSIVTDEPGTARRATASRAPFAMSSSASRSSSASAATGWNRRVHDEPHRQLTRRRFRGGDAHHIPHDRHGIGGREDWRAVLGQRMQRADRVSQPTLLTLRVEERRDRVDRRWLATLQVVNGRRDIQLGGSERLSKVVRDDRHEVAITMHRKRRLSLAEHAKRRPVWRSVCGVSRGPLLRTHAPTVSMVSPGGALALWPTPSPDAGPTAELVTPA